MYKVRYNVNFGIIERDESLEYNNLGEALHQAELLSRAKVVNQNIGVTVINTTTGELLVTLSNGMAVYIAECMQDEY